MDGLQLALISASVSLLQLIVKNNFEILKPLPGDWGI